MAAALSHRGPDSDGFHVDGSLGLAHRRLAILDLTDAGRQPLSNEDGSVWVTYNGQLYDFDGLRERLLSRGHRFRSRTDTEILVHLYEERGEGLLEEIDGMFAFALWDARRRRLLLARDRLGIKPLYLTRAAGRIAFASEVRALLALPWVSRQLDQTALVQYLFQSSVPGHATTFSEIAPLGPGELIVSEDGALSRRRYWSPPLPAEPHTADLQAASRELTARLSRAVATHLVADVPVGVFLSGGLDSTAVARAARSAVPGELHSFSVSFSSPRLDEGPAARHTADLLGTVHHELPVREGEFPDFDDFLRDSDQPFAVASAVALRRLARFARETVKVVLTGDGADELLAGYPWRHEPETGPGATTRSLARGLGLTLARGWRGARTTGPGLLRGLASRGGRLFADPPARYAEIVCGLSVEEMERLVSGDLRETVRRAWRENAIAAAFRDAGDPDPTNRRLRADLATSLCDEMLTKVDRYTMSWGLEARVPFLDRSMVEWSLRVPGRLKISRGEGKRLLRHGLADAAPAVARRPKRGFDPPVAAWLRGPLRERLADTLSPASIRARGMLEPRAVERTVEAHLSGRADASRVLFTLLVLESWLAMDAAHARAATRRVSPAIA